MLTQYTRKYSTVSRLTNLGENDNAGSSVCVSLEMLGHEFKQSIDLGVAQVPRLCPDEHTSENARWTKEKT